MVLVAFFRTWDDYLVGNMRLAFLRLPHASVPLSAASILGAAFFITSFIMTLSESNLEPSS